MFSSRVVARAAPAVACTAGRRAAAAAPAARAAAAAAASASASASSASDFRMSAAAAAAAAVCAGRQQQAVTAAAAAGAVAAGAAKLPVGARGAKSLWETVKDGVVEGAKAAEEGLKDVAEETLHKVVDNLPSPAPSGKTEITNHELLEQVQTGDLILWSGSEGISTVIRFATKSAFSHASVVIRGPLDDSEVGTRAETEPRLLQSTWSEFKEDVDGSHKLVSRSVMINDLADVLIANERGNEPATLRVIRIPEGARAELHRKIAAFALKTDHDIYPQGHIGNLTIPSPEDFIRALLHQPGKAKDDAYFCSEIVADAYAAAGILDTSKRPGNRWTPADFSDAEEPLLKSHLKFGYGFADEVRVHKE